MDKTEIFERVPHYITSNKSNIMSVSEQLVLRWLELNQLAATGRVKRYSNFEKDLRNGLAFYYLL